MNKKLLAWLGFVFVAISSTLAWYLWASNNNTIVKGNVCTPEITFVGGNTINGSNLKPVFKKEDGLKKDIEITLDNECGTYVEGSIYLIADNLPEELQVDSFVIQIWQDDEILNEYYGSDFADGNEIPLIEDWEMEDGMTFTLYIWINANYDNPASMANQSFSFKLYGSGIGAISDAGVTATQYITNLYTGATKTKATVNNITYNLAPSVHLMNDRNASMSTSINGGNIRYYGASPNNYVWLGYYYTEDMTFPGFLTDSGYADYEECIVSEGYADEEGNFNSEEDEMWGNYYCNIEDLEVHSGDRKLWRIIGIIDGKLKLIQDAPISEQTLSWDTSTEDINYGYGINEWSQSDLMKLLNPGYDNNEVNNSLYWNKEEGTVYTGWRESTTYDISFESTGLSEDEQAMIDTVTWYTGAYNDFSYADVHYQAERQNMGKICTQGTTNCNDSVTRTNTWNGKVGLMSASDYGYSTDLNVCNQTMGNYWEADCIFNTWLKVHNGWEWTVSPFADSGIASNVFGVNGGFSSNSASTGALVRPAVYLKSGVTISGGDGSQSHPYELSY